MLYDSVDLDWTWDGDYILGADGDFQDTSDDQIRSLENEIATIVKSELEDWEKDPTVGAGLSDFVGEANTRENGKKLEDRVRFRLVDIGIVRQEDLSVRVIPLHIHRVMISINVVVLATHNNRLEIGNPVSVNIVYDTTEHGIYVMPPADVRELYG